MGVLTLDFFVSNNVDEATIKQLVATDDKKRFGLDVPPGEHELHIRAHQGHSIREVADHQLLSVASVEDLECLCHGTYQQVWETIKQEGLKTMGRNHIHCVPMDLAL